MRTARWRLYFAGRVRDNFRTSRTGARIMSTQRWAAARAAAVAITVAAWAAVLAGAVFVGPTNPPLLDPQKPTSGADVAPTPAKPPQAGRWRVSRTPWGDPDLQGSFG